MSFALTNIQPCGTTKFLAPLYKNLGLIDRHKLVGIAVDDQHRWHVRMNEINGRNLAHQLLALVGGIGTWAKGRFEIFENTNSHRILPWLAVIEEIRWRK